MSRSYAVIVLSFFLTFPMSGRAATDDEPATVKRSAPEASVLDEIQGWLAPRHLGLGAGAGLDLVVGELGREFDPGFALRVTGAFDIGYLTYLRGELSLGFAREGRAVEAAKDSLLRFPAAASLLAMAPMEPLLGEVADVPTPYLRAGFGVSPTLVGRKNAKTRLSEGATHLLLQWGLGLRYPLNRLRLDLLPEGLVARLDATHTAQLDSTSGHFIGITLGLEKEIAFDRDGDGMMDAEDRCPVIAEDPDGVEAVRAETPAELTIPLVNPQVEARLADR